MSTPLRLGLLYATMFAALGASIPYMPVLFRELGFSGTQIAVILSAPMFARVLLGPLIAIWADRFQRRRTPAAILLAAAGAAFLIAGVSRDFPLMAAAGFVWGVAQPGAVPLLDVMTLRRARREGFAYGWPRGIGSLGYIAANLGWGAMLVVAGARSTPWLAAALLLGAAALALWLIPPEPVHDDGAEGPPSHRFEGLGELLRNRAYVLAVFAAGLSQASHAFYYSFSTLIWTGQGLSTTVIGLLWGTGVAVEVLFFWCLGRAQARLGPERLLLLGAAAGVLRWSAYAFSPPLELLFPLQALHSLSFAATFLGSLQLIERLTPARHASLAQTLSASLSSGLLIGAATLASGPLFDAFGARGYGLMALMCAAGFALGVLLFRQPHSSGEGGSATEPT